MGSSTENPKKVLILYYSFSSQTKNLLQAVAAGMEGEQISVFKERIDPVTHLQFPIGTIPKTVWIMLCTFFRQRTPIKPIAEDCFNDFDLIILAGPTWSYNPSGPVLSLFDRDGKKVFNNQTVIPLISCRGYWRMHWWGLKSLLVKCGATVPNLIVFSHPTKEPWRTVGVFLKLAGYVPEKLGWMKGHYNKYGHTRDQIEEARKFGKQIGSALVKGDNMEQLDFKTSHALY